MSVPVIRAQFEDIERFAKEIAEPGDYKALASRGNDTIKSKFDQEVHDLYAAVDKLLRSYHGPDADALKIVIDEFKPSFASMSATMASHADYLRDYVSRHRQRQQINREGITVMNINDKSRFTSRV